MVIPVNEMALALPAGTRFPVGDHPYL